MCIVCNTIARGAGLAYSLVAGRKSKAEPDGESSQPSGRASRFECADTSEGGAQGAGMKVNASGSMRQ